MNNGQAATQKKALPGNSWVNNPNIDLNLLKYIKPIVCNFSIFFHCSAPVGWGGIFKYSIFQTLDHSLRFFCYFCSSFSFFFLSMFLSSLTLFFLIYFLLSCPSFLLSFFLSFQLSFSFILFLWNLGILLEVELFLDSQQVLSGRSFLRCPVGRSWLLGAGIILNVL